MLDALVGEGLATYRDGRLSGFSLTKTGRERHAELLAAELDEAGARSAVDDAYRRFLALNADLLAICTAWQLRDVDGESIAQRPQRRRPRRRGGGAAQRPPRRCRADLRRPDRVARSLRWLRRPRSRMRSTRVVAGDGDWFTKPMIPSYHTVWFEMHEDLLSTLGIERGSEASH